MSSSGPAFRRRGLRSDGLDGRAYRPADPEAHAALQAALRALDDTGQRTPCQGPEAEAWTADDTETQALAGLLCLDGCPVVEACRAAGAREPAGVWGGVSRVIAPNGGVRLLDAATLGQATPRATGHGSDPVEAVLDAVRQLEGGGEAVTVAAVAALVLRTGGAARRALGVLVERGDLVTTTPIGRAATFALAPRDVEGDLVHDEAVSA